MSNVQSDEPLSMLRYWVDKRGLLEALEDYYPNLIRDDKVLKAAYEQALVADAALEGRIKELMEQNDDDQYS